MQMAGVEGAEDITTEAEDIMTEAEDMTGIDVMTGSKEKSINQLS
jgi:hypothetical protein